MQKSESKLFCGAVCGVMVLALAGGCGKKEQNIATPGGNVKVTQQGSGATLEMDSKGEKVKITANDKGVALPGDFPSDVPIMPGATVKMAMSTGNALSVAYSIPGSQADALKYYEENFKAKGWEIAATMNMGDTAMISAKKGKRECVMNVGKEGSGSIVQLIAPLEKS